jgi:hypothetical protein
VFPEGLIATLVLCAAATRLEVHERAAVPAFDNQRWRIGLKERGDNLAGGIAAACWQTGPCPCASPVANLASMDWYHESEQSAPACAGKEKTMRNTAGHLIMKVPEVLPGSETVAENNLIEKTGTGQHFGLVQIRTGNGYRVLSRAFAWLICCVS